MGKGWDRDGTGTGQGRDWDGTRLGRWDETGWDWDGVTGRDAQQNYQINKKPMSLKIAKLL